MAHQLRSPFAISSGSRWGQLWSGPGRREVIKKMQRLCEYRNVACIGQWSGGVAVQSCLYRCRNRYASALLGSAWQNLRQQLLEHRRRPATRPDGVYHPPAVFWRLPRHRVHTPSGWETSSVMGPRPPVARPMLRGQWVRSRSHAQPDLSAWPSGPQNVGVPVGNSLVLSTGRRAFHILRFGDALAPARLE